MKVTVMELNAGIVENESMILLEKITEGGR